MTLAMSSPKLRELTRAQLQSLAKREVVRAVGKTEDIIRRLIQKYPRGVPVPEDTDNPSASLAPPKRSVLKIRIPRRGISSPSAVSPSGGPATKAKGKGKSIAKAASPSPSSSSETLRLLLPEDEPAAGPSNTGSVPISGPEVIPDCRVSFSGARSRPSLSEHPPHQAPNEGTNTQSGAASPQAPSPGWQADEEGEEEVYDELDYPKGAPDHYIVVDAFRQFTTLVNNIPSVETRIAESRCLLQRTETLLEKAIPDARELTVTREYLETFLLAKMKQKRELWDGTARMSKADRKLRMEWLKAERKAENEKRWKETNELYKKHGLPPEPFSTFVSHSDEEVIESLQTTPASSRSGSSKRTREECVNVDGESDGGYDSGDKHQEKKARTRF